MARFVSVIQYLKNPPVAGMSAALAANENKKN
jgi:hypothetical protein